MSRATRIRELKEERARLVEQLRSANDGAAAAGREFTQADADTYNRHKARYLQLSAELKREEELLVYEAEMGSAGRSSDPFVEAGGDRDEPDGEQDGGEQEPQGYHSAFSSAMVRGVQAMAPAARDLLFSVKPSKGMQAAMNEVGVQAFQRGDSDSLGGWLAASRTFKRELIKAADELLEFRKLTTVEEIAGVDDVDQLVLRSDFDDFVWSSEVEAPVADELIFGGRNLHPFPIKKEVIITLTLLKRLSERRALTLIRDRLSYRLATTYEYAGMLGDGNRKYLGMFVASDAGIPTSRDVEAGNEPGRPRIEGVIRAIRSVHPTWQSSKSFRIVGHPDVFTELLLEKDGEGRYVLLPRVDGMPADTIFNKRLLESRFAPKAMVPGAYVFVVGDLRWYHIVDSEQLLLLPHDTFIRNNKKGFIALAASDGAPALAEAFARVKLPAA